MSTLSFRLTNLFIFNTIACFFALWGWLAKDYASVPTYLTTFEGYHEVKDEIEVITVGHSHAAAIDFEALSLGKGRHFFVPSTGIGPAITSIALLQKELPNLKYVMWPISRGTLERNILLLPRAKIYTRIIVSNLPVSFEVTKNFTIGSLDFYFTERLIRLRSLRWQVDEYINNQLGLLAAKRPFSQKSNHYTYKHGLRNEAFTRVSNIKQQKTDATIAAEKLHKDAEQLIDHKKTAQYNLEKLKQQLEKFSKSGITLVLFEAPQTPYYREQVVRYKALDELEEVVKPLSNIHFFRRADWLDWTLEGENIYFHDSNHLNRAGAKYFSSHLREELLKSQRNKPI